MCSRIFGLVRDQIILFLLGATRLGDIWAMAFMIPNLFRRLIAEGAMSSAFVPIFSELTEAGREAEARAFMRSIFSLILIVSTLLVTIMVLALPSVLPTLLRLTNPTSHDISQETLGLLLDPARMMFPYLLFVSLAAICQGILNVNNRFAIASATPIALNISIIGCGLLLKDHGPNPIFGLGIGVLIGGFLQFFMQWVHLYRLGFYVVPTVHFLGKRTIEAIRLWLPSVFSAGVVQINALVSTMIAANLLAGAAITVATSSRLMELVLGVFGVAVSTSMLPVLSKQRARNDYNGMSQSLFGSIELMSLVAIPAAIGMLLAGPSLINLLFARGKFDASGVELTYIALVFHAMAIVPTSWYRISIQTFYAFKQVKHTVFIAATGAIINIICCFTLPKYFYYPHAGVACAMLVSSWIMYVLTRIMIAKKFELTLPDGINREMLKILLASASFVPLWFPFSNQPKSPLHFLGLVFISIAIFAIVAAFLKIRAFYRLVRRR